ncbi:proline-rich protein [Talaromyces proteolyticus]|uniref:Proline-rich protein n=1 Tax=Talaromyces proteolyticus TaxID=1131652 RepID=A0AAD4KLJ4_9EURO|nr:proline-rich protein [Talaromyces proteolyticus]KAH8695478.1 proline-rich protein [Talaromyces proteolyticus]
MTASAQFQLFPSPAKNKKNPFQNMSSREKPKDNSPVSPVSSTASKAGIKTESVIIQIIEDTNTDAVQQQPKHYAAGVAGNSPENMRTQDIEVMRQDERPDSAFSHDDSRLHPSNERLPRNRSPISPGQPIRSMFPQYNPNVPLNEQQYFPQNGNLNSTTQPSGSSSTAARLPPADVDVLLGPKTVPASVLNFPSDELSPRVQYSTAEDLLTLWESANGQELQESLGTFNMRVERTDTATFTFGDPLLPFYTLQASPNGLSIMRNHPLKSNRGVHVMSLLFEDPARRQPPHDGLVTVIFSKLASMLAVEQAKELTRQHRLAPSEAVEVETHAVNRAAAQESCRLIWNANQNRYELQHPSLLKQHSPFLVGEDGNPLSRVQTMKPGILHISVSPSPDSDSVQPPTIVVTSPTPPNSVRAADTAATPRTSTLPQPDHDELLAWFDLGTMSLSICAGLTTAIIPSLYAIDSLVAAILTVAVTDPATNPILANADLYVPSLGTPRTPGNTNRKTRLRNSLASTAQKTQATFSGKLFATLAEREEAEEEAKLMAQIRTTEAKERSKKKKKEKSKGGFSLFRKKDKAKSKQIVVEEFDLEKYSQFGRGSTREGEQLPGTARALVSMLVFGLQLVVTILSAGVKCAVWMVVNVTRCVTSEKF